MADARPRPGIALCLAGGGFPGALFEFGAVGALEAALDGWRLADSRVVVGTSSGAVVGAILAMGVTSREVQQALRPVGRHPLSLRRRDFSRVPWRDHVRGWAEVLFQAPRLVAGRRERSRWERLQESVRVHLPAGFFSNVGLEELITRVGTWSRRNDRFQDLEAPLLVTATDLDSGGRSVFSAETAPSVPVSLAVRASAAIPGFFAPVRVEDRDYIDGQIYDPIHIDLAAAPGVRTVFVVTPLNPYVRESEPSARTRTVDLGASGVLEQSARISAEIKRTASRERFFSEHPEIHGVFIEPGPAEVLELMQAGFARRSVITAWRIGFRAAARTLQDQATSLTGVLEADGIRLDLGNLDRVGKEWDAGL